MLVCMSAAKFPTSMVNSAEAHTNGSQRFVMGENEVMNTRRKTAKAAALGPADMNRVTGAGAPWYTSGAQIWKGAAETLKAKPTNMSAAAVPARIAVRSAPGAWSAVRITAKFVLPV